jgi:hypothetical protein
MKVEAEGELSQKRLPVTQQDEEELAAPKSNDRLADPIVLYEPIARKLQAQGASEIERERPIRNHRNMARFDVEKGANEMFVNKQDQSRRLVSRISGKHQG